MSTNKEQWNRRHKFANGQSHTKAEISRVSKIPISVISDVYDRGIGAYKTNPESVRVKGTFKKDPKVPLSRKLSKEQWAMARVYSFVNKLEGRTKLNHDTDLAQKIRSK